MDPDEESAEPAFTASVLSPTSPKPIHVSTPTNIPVLARMTDVDFNQTETHKETTTRNTEIRDGAWKEPESEEHTTHDESGEPVNEESQLASIPDDHDDHSIVPNPDTAMILHVDDQPTASHTSIDDPEIVSDIVTETVAKSAEPVEGSTETTSLHADLLTSADPPILQNDGQTQQTSASTLPSNVDVQSLLSFLQRPPQSASSGSNAVHPTDVNDKEIIAFTPHDTAHEQAEGVLVHAQQDASVPGADLVNALATSASSAPADLTAALLGHTASPPTLVPTSRAPSSQRERKIAAGEPVTEDDVPWDAAIQLKYDDFIQEERKNVNAGNWDAFPYGSRLFVGNLSSDNVTKRDVYHVFHPYGPLAQISIKQSYGFVQFMYAEDCARALQAEQGRMIKDKKIHLEVSKPQKSRNNQNSNRQRSRSPVNRRRNDRDSARYRSPSPRAAYRDRYDNRSPPDYGRSRYGRSMSPQNGDDLPLPRRLPQDVPDVQIIVREDLDHAFISWVEAEFKKCGLKVAVLLLTRLNEEAVIKRQVVEGVLAITRIDRQAQHMGKISLRVFDRSRGVSNVSFDDYDNLDPKLCAELVLFAKSKTAPYAPPPAQYPPQYGQYGYGMPPPQAHPQAAYPQQYTISPQQPMQAPPLNMGSLQNMLAPAPYPPGYPPPPQPGYPAPAPQQNSYNSYGNAPQAFTTIPVQTAPRPAGGQVNMQDLLARLGNYSK